jgi:hypothetical protein
MEGIPLQEAREHPPTTQLSGIKNRVPVKMRLSSIATLSLFVLKAVGAAFEELKIPQVEAIVEATLNRLDAYVHYKGNNSDTTTISKRQGTPYWYENIAHQGISPFGPGGYAVYRNVKNYGAKGDTLYHSS